MEACRGACTGSARAHRRHRASVIAIAPRRGQKEKEEEEEEEEEEEVVVVVVGWQ